MFLQNVPDSRELPPEDCCPHIAMGPGAQGWVSFLLLFTVDMHLNTSLYLNTSHSSPHALPLSHSLTPFLLLSFSLISSLRLQLALADEQKEVVRNGCESQELLHLVRIGCQVGWLRFSPRLHLLPLGLVSALCILSLALMYDEL